MLNLSNVGINIDDINVCILLYANDIVLLRETEKGLQNSSARYVKNGKSSLMPRNLTFYK